MRPTWSPNSDTKSHLDPSQILPTNDLNRVMKINDLQTNP